MTDTPDAIAGDRQYPGGERDRPSFEKAPLTRSEYIAALVHFYRGEMYRATQWRLRLDNSTNWALLSVVGLVTFSLGEPMHSHVGILTGMALVSTFLSIEARRFRFFDVWRSRVRMLEENFYGPILRRDLQSPIETWGVLVAEDLLHPRFKITYHQALRARFLRNYGVLFVILLVSWMLKLLMHPGPADTFRAVLDRMHLGPIPWWVSCGFVVALYAYHLLIVFLVPATETPEDAYWGREAKERLSRIDI